VLAFAVGVVVFEYFIPSSTEIKVDKLLEDFIVIY